MKKTTLKMTLNQPQATTVVLNGVEISFRLEEESAYEVDLSLSPVPQIVLPAPSGRSDAEKEIKDIEEDFLSSDTKDYWGGFDEPVGPDEEGGGESSAEEAVVRKIEELLAIVSTSEAAKRKAAETLTQLIDADEEEDDEEGDEEEDDGQPEEGGTYASGWLD